MVMKINSKAPISFSIMGTEIYPGINNYRGIDPKDRATLFQLVVLKNDGIIDYNENLEFDLNKLPFENEAEAAKAVKKVGAKKPAPKPLKRVKPVKVKDEDKDKDKDIN